MIFVTVGTHEQPFNRLIKAIDDIKKEACIEDDVIIQSGYSTYVPKYCEWHQWIPYEQILEKVSKARIVITHGGPASFIMPMRIGKIPIVVPRQYKFGEHVNDHQVEFAKAVEKRNGTIIPIYDIEKMKDVIKSYDEIIEKMRISVSSNNLYFNQQIEKIVEEMNI
ncbi:multidrug MFS transporter [Clostridium autoethanogenum]|uniref:Multidrug MFS transporter n=1 Tax=Clostridium autoethanogenum TaxID=84023 RepID=A0A3M0S1I0_9CLOT|nr:glycosyltransferase [Clostridium autoethanogenum]RMC92318.1 multidrug MFS transporter [Clostridium autoethanogenum]